MATPPQASGRSQTWRFTAALVMSAIVWLLAWYLDTVQSVVAIWERSDTFAHGYLIVPISAWLIWRQRHLVAALEPRPNFFVLLALALAGFAWLLGQLAAVGVVQQYALVFMLLFLIWTVVGDQVVRVLAFPLAFLLFAVPFGEFLQPVLMEHTADFLVVALRLIGIPVYREGLFLTIPSGSWSVVEACSGLRYLIASVTLGTLYAYLTYRSFARRAIFITASVIVPIIANWLRAFMIVMIGHLSSMKYAVGVDHLIYGWVFFGLVMLALFWVGSIWREDLGMPTQTRPPMPAATRNAAPLETILAATVAAAVMAAAWPFVAARLGAASPMLLPSFRAPPPLQGWKPVAGRVADWRPRFSSPRAEIDQVYARDGTQVGLYVGYYRNQRQDSQLVSSQNTLVPAGSGWASAGETQRSVAFNNQNTALIEAQLRGRTAQVLVWRWYWVDGRFTANPYWAKALQAKSMLLGRSDDGAVVVLYTELDKGREQVAGRLQEFANAMLPGITQTLEHAREVRPRG